MQYFDWLIVAVLIAITILVASFTRRYSKSVAGFLAANRCGGRYLLAVAEGAALLGVITFVAEFEKNYIAGFSPTFWWAIITPVYTIAALSGWVIYRFRQTRALTLAQFFEIRYSRNFRILAGMLAFVSGIINFGIFPAIGAKFFVYFCGLPPALPIWGIEIPAYIVCMFFLLSIALLVTFWGGQIAIMVVDFLQGAIVHSVLLLVCVLIFLKFSWTAFFDTLVTVPDGTSYLNPFDTGNATFNMWYYLVIIVGGFYNYMGWQSTQGYNAAAKTPHEARMGRVIGIFRGNAYIIATLIIGVGAYIAMHHPSSAALASDVQTKLVGLETSKAQVQMTTPLVLARLLPIGLVGILCATMVCAFISNHSTFLHSWGIIFIQDVVLPIRKRPLSPEEHIKWLKFSIGGVAVFVFLWSCFLHFEEYILMYWTITSAIFLGGSGSVIIGGLYWKRGTTAGAYAGLLAGSGLAVLGFIIRGLHPDFPLQAHWIYALSIITSILTYIVISLTSRKSAFDMDRLLHRGKYAIQDDLVQSSRGVSKGWKKLLGISNEFTRVDSLIYVLAIIYIFGMSLLCIAYGIYYTFGVHNETVFANAYWMQFWKVFIYIMFSVSVIAVIWVIIGGILNVISLFKTLAGVKRVSSDDGSVIISDNTANREMSSVDCKDD